MSPGSLMQLPAAGHHPMRGSRRHAWLLVAMAATAHSSPDERAQFGQIDQQFGSYRLGAPPALPAGREEADGELACGEYPNFVCSYDQGGYVYYYNEGSLVSKTFVFGPRTPNGPLDLKIGDDAQIVISKISPYIEGKAPGRAEQSIYYIFQCLPRQCRLDIRFGENGIVDVELSSTKVAPGSG